MWRNGNPLCSNEAFKGEHIWFLNEQEVWPHFRNEPAITCIIQWKSKRVEIKTKSIYQNAPHSWNAEKNVSSLYQSYYA